MIDRIALMMLVAAGGLTLAGCGQKRSETVEVAPETTPAATQVDDTALPPPVVDGTVVDETVVDGTVVDDTKNMEPPTAQGDLIDDTKNMDPPTRQGVPADDSN